MEICALKKQGKSAWAFSLFPKILFCKLVSGQAVHVQHPFQCGHICRNVQCVGLEQLVQLIFKGGHQQVHAALDVLFDIGDVFPLHILRRKAGVGVQQLEGGGQIVVHEFLQLSLFAGETVPLTFIPHLLPNIRGIFSTIYVRLKEKGKSIDYQALYEKVYADEPFVDVLPEGSLPETRMVRGSNMVRIALYRKEPDLLVVLVVEDNLVKGSAGQAVQAMNLVMGLPQTEGLEQIALVP